MNQTEPVSTIVVSELDTRGLARGERFDAWRDGFAPLFDVQRGAHADRGDFCGVVKAYALPGLVIAESACPTETIWRRRRGRGAASDGITGDDPLVLHLHRAGTSRGRNGEREMHTRPGDISLTDLGNPYLAVDDGFRCLSLVIPREPLLPQLRIDGSPGGLVLAAGAPLTEILTSHLAAVWRVLPRLRPEEALMVADGLMAAVAQAFRPLLHASDVQLDPPARTTLAAATELIEAHLDRPDLGPAYLCHALGCSRSQLYRLFEPLGGVAGYIRDQRLLRAWHLLTTVASRKARIIDIAHRCGFTDQTHFSRLFRRHFGMTPRDARHLSIDDAAQVSSSADRPAHAHWFSGLRTERAETADAGRR